MNRKSYDKFDGGGLRYELAKIASLVKDGERRTIKRTSEELIAISSIIEKAKTNKVEI